LFDWAASSKRLHWLIGAAALSVPLHVDGCRILTERCSSNFAKTCWLQLDVAWWAACCCAVYGGGPALRHVAI
jgi:hypothetical protein